MGYLRTPRSGPVTPWVASLMHPPVLLADRQEKGAKVLMSGVRRAKRLLHRRKVQGAVVCSFALKKPHRFTGPDGSGKKAAEIRAKQTETGG